MHSTHQTIKPQWTPLLPFPSCCCPSPSTCRRPWWVVDFRTSADRSTPPFWGRLCGVSLSRPQLQDDCRQDEEESVPAQGNSEASPHHHPRQTPAWWEDLYLHLLHRLKNKRKNKQRVDTEKDKVDDFSTRFMQTVIKKFWDCTYKKAETLPPHFKVVSICTYVYFPELVPI